MPIKFFIILLLAVSIIYGIYFLIPNPLRTDSIKKESSDRPLFSLLIKDKSLRVELAKSEEEKIRGLSGRETLEEDKGMFFIFDKPGFYSFWMKDMLFPIDIIWIDENYRIVDITENALPESFPATFQPKTPAKFVLEVNAGWAEKNDIQINDTIKLPQNL